MKKFITLIAIAFAFIESNAQGVWTQKTSISGLGREGSSSFSIGTKGYVVCGVGSGPTYYSDLWEFDQQSNTWTQKANFPGTPRSMAAAFSIGTKGYFGTGNKCCPTNTNYNDFWEWDQGTNMWTQKASVPYNPWGAVGLSIGNKGYIGLGVGANHYSSFYEYDPMANNWATKASFGGGARREAVAFSIGGKGYMGTGCDYQGSYRDFWEFDPVTNFWVQKADVGLTPRFSAVGFSVGNNGYIGVGGNNLQDFWEFNQANNTWIQMANFGGTGRGRAIGFAIGSKGYIGTGTDANGQKNDLWEWGSCLVAPPQPIGINGLISICQGSTNTYSIAAVNGATSYTWTLPNGWTGTSVSTSIIATASATSGNVTVTANNACGSSVAQSLSVTVNPIYNINANSAICQGDSILLAGSYQKTTGNYTDLFQSINGCDSTVITALTVNPLPTVTLGNQNAVCMNAPAFALSGGAPAGGTYSGVGVNNNQFDPAVAGAGTHTITYSYSDPNTGCGNSSTNTIVINPLPTVTLGAFTAVCADAAAFALTGGLPAGGTYSGVGINNNQFDAAVAGAGTHTITYTYTDGNTNCSNSATNTIVVNPLPPAPIITVNGNTFTSSAASGNQWYLNGNPINGATNQTFVCTVNGNYTVCITDANGCKSCSAVLNFTTIGISENINGNEIIVYPNPFSSTINVIARPDASIGTWQSFLTIYNTLGEIIYSTQLTTQPLTINLDEVPTGIYFLQLKNDTGTVTKKIIKD